MGVGKKRGGKHWTTAQKESRQAAANAFERRDGTKLAPPEWLSKEAIQIWDKKIAEIAGLNAGSELLDALDCEVLAVFCDAVVKYKKLSTKSRITVESHKLMQTYMLRILGYSERLGFTPGARARLIKRRADGPDRDMFGEMFD
jgi:phage terminase small subunit